MNLDVQHAVPRDHLRGSDPRIAAAVRLGAEHRASRPWPGGASRTCCGRPRSCCSASTARCPTLISIDLANALLFTAFAVTWTGARLFDHRQPRPFLMFAGAAHLARWQSACPALPTSFDLRVLLSSGIITGLYLGDGVRILARSQRAPGLALAGDLHAVRARRALSVAHAVRRRCCRGCRRAIRYSRASGSPCSASKRCCSRSRSPSSCWRWRRSAPSIGTRPPRWSIR